MARSRIFLSYRRTDRGDLVERLYDRLEQHFGHDRVFIDVDGIPAGADFVTHIENILGQCAVVVAVIGPRWIEELGTRAAAAGAVGQADFVRVELERALALDTPILPLLLGDARMPAAASLPESLAPVGRLQAAHLRSGPDFKADVQRLIASLERLAGAPRSRDVASAAAPAGSTRVRIAVSSADIQQNPGRLAGLRIGPYLIRAVIGAGGSGVALAATHVSLAREVCLKLSYPLGERTQVLMTAIRRGMRGLVQLDHPNIAKVYDFEEIDLDDGWSFYVALEFIDGVTVDEWARGTVSAPGAGDVFPRQMRMARQIAEGLTAAHACRYADDAGFQITGVMHGDIKPSNIMVRANDVPVLIDFMLVDVQRHLLIQSGEDPESRPTDALTAAFGTPGFMAPEQQRLGIVTPATDVFGLGMTLVRCFMDALNANDTFRRLTITMVAEKPDARPGSMREVAAALLALEQSNDSASADPGEGPPRGPRPGALRTLLRKLFP